jgi:hypothetical protein
MLAKIKKGIEIITLRNKKIPGLSKLKTRDSVSMAVDCGP